MALLIGGESFSDQERKLDRGVDVLIATPGRMLDLFERGKILLSDVKILVIDEADRMLDMGFIPDVERIVGFLPRIRQTLFFSATMPPEIRRLADAFLMNPKEISVAPPAAPPALVTQHLVTVDPDDKREALRRLILSEDVKNAIIFCNRKRDVDILHRSLARHGLNVAALHGDMPQSKRTETLERFRDGEIRLLVASDVAARGLDVQGMSHVFNFDVPIHAEDYVHRIGRTGRAGREGRAFTIATPEDGRFVQAITRLIGKDIPVITIDGIGTATLSEEEGDTRRRGPRDRSRGRGREQRRDGRPPRQTAEERAAPRPSAQPPREPRQAVEERAAPRPSAQPPRESRPAAEKRPGPHPAPREPRQRRRQAPPREALPPITMDPDGKVMPLPARRAGEPQPERDDDGRIVGFGDHLPAFLARSIKMARG